MAELHKVEDIHQQNEIVDFASGSSTNENIVKNAEEAPERMTTNKITMHKYETNEYSSVNGKLIEETQVCYCDSEEWFKGDGNNTDGRDIVHDALNMIAYLCYSTLIRRTIEANRINFQILRYLNIF